MSSDRPSRRWLGPAPVVAAALVVALLGTGAGYLLTGGRNHPAATSFPTPTGTLGGNGHPNIVFVLTDDLSSNLLPYLPHVLALQRQGVTFDDYVVSDSLCCPSRSSILTGRFPHNTKIFTNSRPDGGFGLFHALGEESSTVATDLKAAGYATGLMGKYLNQYEPDSLPTGERRFVPPGWSEWDVAGQGYPEFDYTLNQNHTLVRYAHRPEDYLTDVLSARATSFIARQASAGTPFFLEVATFAPHAPYTPAPRHSGDFPGLGVPRTPAYDAAVSNPPTYLQGRRRLTAQQRTRMDGVFRLRAQDVESVDELIAAVEKQLVDSGVAGNTYLVFSSDNGFHLGEHRLTGGKQTAFDTDIRVPLVIAGPGIPAGVHTSSIAQNVDLRPTFDMLAGTRPPQQVDGHALLPLPNASAGWRNAALVEHHGPKVGPSDPDFQSATAGNPPSYAAIRLPGATYVEYADGSSEYYDLVKDPYELDNLAATLPAPRKRQLHQALAALTACSGDSCWSAAHVATP